MASVNVTWRVACYQMGKSFSLTSLSSVAGALSYLTESMNDWGFPGQAIAVYVPEGKESDFPLLHPLPLTSPKPRLHIAFLQPGDALLDSVKGA